MTARARRKSSSVHPVALALSCRIPASRTAGWLYLRSSIGKTRLNVVNVVDEFIDHEGQVDFDLFLHQEIDQLLHQGTIRDRRAQTSGT